LFGLSIHTLSHSKASSIHHPAMPMNSSHLPRVLAKTSYSILSPISALSTKHAVYEHKSSFSYCQIARTTHFVSVENHGALPGCHTWRTKVKALTQFTEEFHLGFRLLRRTKHRYYLRYVLQSNNNVNEQSMGGKSIPMAQPRDHLRIATRIAHPRRPKTILALPARSTIPLDAKSDLDLD